MNTKNARRHACRALVALVSASLAFGPLVESAYAGPTPLADVPIAAKVAAKPNIVYTLDDSGSMQFSYLPDWVLATAPLVTVTKITRVGTTATAQVASTAALSTGQYVVISGANQPEYNGQFPITVIDATHFTFTIVGAPTTPATGALRYAVGTPYCRGGNWTAACSAGAVNTFTSPPFYAADFNRLMYDPNVNYTPPVKADGKPLTHTIGVDTDINGNQINLAKVQTDPFTSPASQVNLSVKVAVPLYCNTDWPVTAGVNLAITDVGDVNGEYAAGTGAWCRINGTKYDASAASGAPAVQEDYNYPYQLTSGANGTQYFYRQLGNKILYCDKTSPYWPPNGTIVGCTLGGTPTCGGLPCPVIQQKCNQKAKVCNPNPALRNYTPAGCGVGGNPLYCGPYGTGSAPECLPCSCNSDTTPVPPGSCSITGAACNGPFGIPGADPACPDQPQAPNGCSAGVPIYGGPAASAACNAFTWDPVAGVYSNVSNPPGTTLLQDSDPSVPGGSGLGLACRHNNQVYAVSGVPVAGGPFTYPRTNIGDVYPANAAAGQLGQFTTQATAAGCPTIGTTVSIPRHYYTIDSVQFCDNVDGTVNGQWRGFGTGVCTTAGGLPHPNDLTQYQNVQYGQFHRIPLRPGWNGGNYDYIDQATQLPATRTYAQEIVNYANWYAYYRLRMLAAKTTSALAFDLLDDTYRVGFHTLGTEPLPIGNGLAPQWVDVNDFDLAQRTSWWGGLNPPFANGLFAVPTVTTNKTPTLSAMLRIGNLFETGGAGGLPASVNPLPAGAQDPISTNPSNGQLISCQSNYHILFTDGFTNQVALPTVAGDQDQNIPGTLPADVPGDPDKVLPDLRVPAWPKPFMQGAPAVSDTLSDIGTYYWARDLRPALKDDVPNWSGKTPQDLDPAKDVAWWQHVQFSAISFGSAGTLDAADQVTTMAGLTGGALTWPDLTAPNNPLNPPSNKGAVAVDDLWHATAMARGTFVYATSPIEVQMGLSGILAGIANQPKTRVGAAFSGQVLSATNNIIYEATIEQGWAGDLLKVQIDPTNGNELAQLWSAATAVKDQIDPLKTGVPEPWMDEAHRRIVSWNGATKVAFRATAAGSMVSVLSNAQLNTLSGNPTTQKKMVAYLRGGNVVNPPVTAVPTVIEGTKIGQFRKRYGPLGDISNAQPLVVTAPIKAIFYDGNDPGFSAFQALQAARPDQIVAAANDGMVHVFDVNDGHEAFGYVPSSLFRAAVDASGKPTGLQALTFQDGGVPIYKHHFYVDSSPRTANIDFNSAGVKGGASDWHTIVVGGMGKGGDSYYALDLTDPNVADESAAAAKLLWEYHDPDWQYTYGRPVIAKTYAFGWTVIVTSGYNNVSGEGRIYFLNPVTGKPFAAKPYLSTGAVSCTGPDGSTQTSGLAQINGFTKDYHNQFVEQVYGGDLCGNLWRFDINDPNPANWTVNKFAILDDGVAPQPVTTAPQIEIDLNNGVDRYVFIGTGRLLDPSDLTTPFPAQQQTMYAIRDGSLATPLPAASLPILRGQLTPVPAGGAKLAGTAAFGWFHDLPTGANAERIVFDVEADANAVTYVGTQVQSDPCIIALPADIYAREFTTAESLINDPLNGWFSFDAKGGVGMQVVGLTDPVTGEVTLGGLLTHETRASTKPIQFKNPGFGSRNRFSWRLLTGE